MPRGDFYPTEKQYYMMHRRLHFCFDIKFYPHVHVAMLKGLHTSRSLSTDILVGFLLSYMQVILPYMVSSSIIATVSACARLLLHVIVLAL